MPLIHKDSLPDGSMVGVWHIAETADELLAKIRLTEAEHEVLRSYKHEGRQKQWLSYRALLAEMVAVNYHINYSDFGKPFLRIEKKNSHLSITHSGEYSAVIINENLAVGIDIESPSKRIERVADRFMSEAELQFMDARRRLEHLTVCWCAKEALFKIHGNLCYDFKEQICIEPFVFSEEGSMDCSIEGHQGNHKLKVYFRKINEYFLAHVAV